MWLSVKSISYLLITLLLITGFGCALFGCWLAAGWFAIARLLHDVVKSSECYKFLLFFFFRVTAFAIYPCLAR